MIDPFKVIYLQGQAALRGEAWAPREVLAVATTECLMEVEPPSRERGPVRLLEEWPLAIGFRNVGDPGFDPQLDDFNIEALAFVEDSAFEPGDARAEIPAGKFMSAHHTGPYDTVLPALRALKAWIEAQGLRPQGAPYQLFPPSPEDLFDRGFWDTLLVWRISGSGRPRKRVA
jgi:hypothetical protein